MPSARPPETREILTERQVLTQEQARQLCAIIGRDPAEVVQVLFEPNRVTVQYVEPRRTDG